jgi:hypothetical protein
MTTMTRGRRLGCGPGNKFTAEEWAALSRRDRDREWSKYWREQPENKKRVSKRNRKRWKTDKAFRERELDRSRKQRSFERQERAGERFAKNVTEKAAEKQAELARREAEVAQAREGLPCQRCKGVTRSDPGGKRLAGADKGKTIDPKLVAEGGGPIPCRKCDGLGLVRVKKKGPPAGIPRKARFVEIPGVYKGFVFPVGMLAVKTGRSSPTLRFWIEHGILPGCTIAFARRCYFSPGFMDAVLKALERVYLLNGQGRRDMLGRLIREELTNAGETWIPRGGSERDRVRLLRGEA